MEKRKNRRHAKRLRVRFGEADFTQQGFSSDVSATGMFVQTLSIPKLGTRLHIEVTFDGEQRLFFEGVVARQKIVAAELRHVLKGGFGVRFLAGVDLLPEMVPSLKTKTPRVGEALAPSFSTTSAPAPVGAKLTGVP